MSAARINLLCGGPMLCNILKRAVYPGQIARGNRFPAQQSSSRQQTHIAFPILTLLHDYTNDYLMLIHSHTHDLFGRFLKG